MPHNSQEIRHTYKSKHNIKRENQVIILMITDNEKWYYLAVKSLSALFKGITSKHVGDFYCLNCQHLFRTENKLKYHKNVCENHAYCYIGITEKYNEILKYDHEEKSMKASFIIYADTESLLEKINMCHSNPENSSTNEINLHTACVY